MFSYMDFYNLVIGRFFDIDLAFGAQCWDAYAKYAIWLNARIINCLYSGYAKDLWEYRESNGILEDFYEVDIDDLQPGDVVVFKDHPYTPQSHVGILHETSGNGAYILSQNQGGTPYYEGGSAFNVAWFPYDAMYPTAFRPKAYGEEIQRTTHVSQAVGSPNTNWVTEDGYFTSDYAIYARTDGPSTGNATPYLFPEGSVIQYDAYCRANGYLWIRQKRGDGSYWYIPTGESDSYHRTEPAWGTFE